jgi:hypothetical protein
MLPQLMPRGNNYTRRQAMQSLGISSSTLLNYCRELKIEKGLFYFTQEEFEKLTELRKCRLRGRNKFPLNSKIHDQSA